MEMKEVQNQVELRLLDVESRIFHARTRKDMQMNDKCASLGDKNRRHDDKCVSHKNKVDKMETVSSLVNSSDG